MSLPDLDDLIAEVDRTCDRAGTAHGGEQDQPNWPALLEVAARLAGELHALADDLVEDYVEHCRMHGTSWTEIGAVLGVTRQAAQQRYLAPHKRYAADELTDALRTAMTHMKSAAVRHRNNYIGTEHLLWGLLAEENSATRLLESRGVALDELRRAAGARLGVGASQAAERIAFTPYSRKAFALAEDQAKAEETSAIDCHHVLTGLLQVGRGAAFTLLAQAGLDP